MPEVSQQSKAKQATVLVLYMGNRGAAKQQFSPMNDVTEKEPATPLAARPEQRRMPHEHCSVQQLCFPPCLHMLLMQ